VRLAVKMAYVSDQLMHALISDEGRNINVFGKVTDEVGKIYEDKCRGEAVNESNVVTN